MDGGLRPLDTDEIVEAKCGDLAELQGPIRDKLLCAGRGLFCYRVALTDATVEELQRTGERERQARLSMDWPAATGR